MQFFPPERKLCFPDSIAISVIKCSQTVVEAQPTVNSTTTQVSNGWLIYRDLVAVQHLHYSLLSSTTEDQISTSQYDAILVTFSDQGNK